MLLSHCGDCESPGCVVSNGTEHWVECTECLGVSAVCSDFDHEDAVVAAVADWNGTAEPAREHPAVAVLNRLFKVDPDAIHALVVNRVPCNAALADDPTTPVSTNTVTGNCLLGVIGLINGILTEMELPRVAFTYTDHPDQYGNYHLTGFQVHEP